MNPALTYGIEHHDEALGLAYAYGLRSAEDREDAVQEALLAQLERTPANVNPRAYWAQALVWQVRDIQRRNRVRRHSDVEGLRGLAQPFEERRACSEEIARLFGTMFEIIVEEIAMLSPMQRRHVLVWMEKGGHGVSNSEKVAMSRFRTRLRRQIED